MDTIRLYRGDFDKIREFQFSKTKKGCLFGQGVYLTNNRTVADTYRTKGANGQAKATPTTVLFDSFAKNRPEALNKAFGVYLDEYYYARYGRFAYDAKRKAEREKLADLAREEFDRKVAEGLIVAEYFAASDPKTGNRRLRVTQEVRYEVGFISVFDFPRKAFESNVLKVDSVIRDRAFWELMWENKTGFGTPYATKEDFVNYNASPWYGKQRTISVSSSTYNSIRRVIEPYGYIGFEYNGGGYVGGCGRHRAFVIWDDEFVNAHKVRRER